MRRLLHLSSTSERRQRVVLVIPYSEPEVDRLLSALSSWMDAGPACSSERLGQIGLAFYNNLANDGNNANLREKLETIEPFASKVLPCFSSVSTVYANLTAEEEGYPEGPSNMFFKLFLSDYFRDHALVGYTHVMWMEWDVVPVKSLWLDAIVDGAEGDAFWVKGSHYYGLGFDSTVKVSRANSKAWVGHINGNALYNFRDPDFLKFLTLVKEREPPGDYWRPFDVSMWKVLNDLPYSWRLYQHYRPKFQYAPFIVNIGFHNQGDHTATSSQSFFLRHGDTNGAGNTKYFAKFKDGSPTANYTIHGDEIRPEVQLSILMRTYGDDLRFAALAFESARRYVPYAHEYVAVVPESDLEEANKILPKFVKTYGEPNVMDASIQQKYTKLNADKYTEGRYVMHLDSDVVFYRMLNHKDVFVLGKPILEYDLYSNIASWWQAGTSYTMGHPVAYEYSRSNDHVYPRCIYKRAREYLEKRFGMSVRDFMKTRRGVHDITDENENPESLFSDFNYIGAFAHSHMREDFAWTFVGTGFDPNHRADPLSYVVRPKIVCQGNARWWPTEEVPRHMQTMRHIAAGKITDCGSLEAWQHVHTKREAK